MYDFPEEIPEQTTPRQLTPRAFQEFTDELGIPITGDEAAKFTAIIAAIQGAKGGGSIGDDVSTQGLPLEQIGASPDIPGATRGPPLEQIGASPDIPGATRGINPEDDRLRMMLQLIR